MKNGCLVAHLLVQKRKIIAFEIREKSQINTLVLSLLGVLLPSEMKKKEKHRRSQNYFMGWAQVKMPLCAYSPFLAPYYLITIIFQTRILIL